MSRRQFLEDWIERLALVFPKGEPRRGYRETPDEHWIQVDIAKPDLRLLIENLFSPAELRCSLLSDGDRRRLRHFSDKIHALRKKDEFAVPTTFGDFPSKNDPAYLLRAASCIWDKRSHDVRVALERQWLEQKIKWWASMFDRFGQEVGYVRIEPWNLDKL